MSQQKEFKRQETVRAAVKAAENVILDNTDGSVDELNVLIVAVAKQFLAKVVLALNDELQKKETLNDESRG